MNANTIGNVLSRLPQETQIQAIDLYEGKVTIEYMGVSAQAVEATDWNHVSQSDYYGVAEYDLRGSKDMYRSQEPPESGFGFGGSW